MELPMDKAGSSEQPLRVAVVGSGPAGFYTVQHLLRSGAGEVTVDMFDSLPTPFGLVRHGVAPDHPKIKSVTAVYHKLASRPEVRFFGNVEYGEHLTLADLRSMYHQIVVCTGAQTDRRLGIPGEDLPGSHSATEFVAWYNGHPDFAALNFDLGCRSAVVIGAGNVAVDVARILCRTPAELEATDMADYAVKALRNSKIREVHLVGRRGPLQAAFTNPEIKELGEMEDAAARTFAAEVELDELSRQAFEAAPDKAIRRRLEILQSYAGRDEPDKARRLTVRFLVSPVEIIGDGRVESVRLVRNELHRSDDGRLRPRSTGRNESIDAGLVFRSVGYRGVPLPDLPFDDRRAVIPNRLGRIVDPSDDRSIPGLYASGWIKRGPSGVIGTNKPDAAETVRCMVEDVDAGIHLRPSDPALEAPERLLARRGVHYVSYEDWVEIDASEVALGKALDRPRLKFTGREAFIAQLDRR
jgi:ferredoxin--NADP+ reductase